MSLKDYRPMMERCSNCLSIVKYGAVIEIQPQSILLCADSMPK